MDANDIKENYSKELALLILICRYFLGIADADQLRLHIQQNQIDWEQFYHLSAIHRLRPLCYKVLYSFKDMIGEKDRHSFREYLIAFNGFALNNKKELNRILQLLIAKNIHAIPFKGIAFAEKFYGEISVREFSDNDIIVKEHDLGSVIDIMRAEGYKSKDASYFKRFPKQYTRDYKDIFFEKDSGGIREFAFEFHFKPARYFQGYPLSFQQILTGGSSLNDIDHLKLITISNGLIDYYPDIRSVLDIAIVLKGNKPFPLKETDPFLRRFLITGIEISSGLFGFPDNENKTISKFSDHLLEKILGQKAGKRMPILQFLYYNIKNSPTLSSRSKLVRDYFLLITRPNLDDITGISLPWYSLYYFTKPFRLFGKIFRK